MALPRSISQQTLDTDACGKQIGCELLQQEEDGRNRPVGFWSRTSSDKEKKRPMTHRECLVDILDVTLLSNNLEETRFTTQTEYEGLRYILTMAGGTANLSVGD